jgi:tetratricopeptide (TPR) repeat protein
MTYLLCRMERTEEAIKYAKKLPSKEAETHGAKALIQKTLAYKQDTYKLQEKYFKEALKEYEAALKQDPNNIEYHCNKGQMLKALKRDPEGDAAIKAAYALYQNEEIREAQSSSDNPFDKKFIEGIFAEFITGFVPIPDSTPEIPAGLVGFDLSDILGHPDSGNETGGHDKSLGNSSNSSTNGSLED